MTDTPRGAQSALRTIRLLKQVTAGRSELGLAEISRLAGLNKATAHRLLQALLSESMLDRDPDSGRYRLGPAVLALGMQAMAGGDLRNRARPLMKQLAAESGESVTLEVPVEDTMLIIDEISGNHRVAAGGNVGTRWAMHATSTGKAIVAFSEDGIARLGERLTPLTASTITTRQGLEAQLGEIRRRGFAESVDELEDGFTGVGTVVRGGGGEIVAAMSICGPTQRMTEGRRASLGAMLCAAAGQLQPGF